MKFYSLVLYVYQDWLKKFASNFKCRVAYHSDKRFLSYVHLCENDVFFIPVNTYIYHVAHCTNIIKNVGTSEFAVLKGSVNTECYRFYMILLHEKPNGGR